MSSYENLVGAALLGDDKAKTDSMRQITCKLAASTRMVCDCGDILDQSSVHVLEMVRREDGKESTLTACCQSCAIKQGDKLQQIVRLHGAEYEVFWTTWRARIHITG
tara:strand:- start:10 stop:330 length:321 start_codon:yes stop_codon:yes gene_type:complete